MNLLCNDLPERNMTDRELLEAAARAAGLKLYEHRGAFFLHYVDERDSCGSWNPLTDDGDALRLACKLHINVFIYTDETSTASAGVVAKNWGSVEANTRRAIVGAAAAMDPGA
jgi:hypothetical protein